MDRRAALADLADIWGIDEDVLVAELARAAAGDPPEPAYAAQPRPATASGRGAALIPVHGVINRRPLGGLLGLLFGGASTEEISQALRGAMADPQVSRVVLAVDSPGGTIDGVPELADEIYSARAKKPITALVDTTAASAAYWLASQASEVVVTPSSRVGSIGVFSLHLDQSKLLAELGVKPTFIKAGKFKVEENPFEPLSEDAQKAIQERVDTYYGMFVRDVARGRGVSVEQVRKDYGEGRIVLAKDAVARDMADRIGTLDQVLAERGPRVGTIAAFAAIGKHMELETLLEQSQI